MLFDVFQIDTWCKENKYVIAGYYQANERVKEMRWGVGCFMCGESSDAEVFWHACCDDVYLLTRFRPNQVAEKVAARISENFSEAAMIIVSCRKSLEVWNVACSEVEWQKLCYVPPQLDNSRFTVGCFTPILSIYDHLDNKWKCREPSMWVPFISSDLA